MMDAKPGQNGTRSHRIKLRRPTVAPLTGSWIDFRHPNPKEGDYWNEATFGFAAADWETKIEEMAAFGIDTVVVGAVMLGGKSFYPSALVPSKWNHACEDPLESVMAAADRLAMQVYVGLGFFSNDTGKTEADESERHLRREVPLELHARYGGHPSFQGWYLPVEGAIHGHYPETYIRYVNELAACCRAPKADRKILIAPYGTRTVKADDRFAGQVRELEVDHVAYQDEIGVRKTEPHELGAIFGRLRDCHEKAGRPLWADVEIFAFEGAVYGSALIPAPFPRVRAQIEAIAPFAEKLLCYQYLGMVNPSGSRVFAGHPSSAEFDQEYRLWHKAHWGPTAGKP